MAATVARRFRKQVCNRHQNNMAVLISWKFQKAADNAHKNES